MSEVHKVSVILPCYNEAGNIIPLIEEIHKQLVFCPHEIIVVDDNSPDGTYEIVKNLNCDFISPILRNSEPSLAKSIRKGIEESNGDFIIVMDSDFNHQPLYLPQMIKNLEFYDGIFASRFLYGGKMDKRSRHILSWIFNVFVRIMTGGKMTDNLYGFFSIKRETLFNLDFEKIFWGYGDYCIRLLFFLQKHNISILQFPVVNGRRLNGSGNSKFIGVFWKYFKAVIKLSLIERI